MKNGPEAPLNLPSLEKDLQVVCSPLKRHTTSKKYKVRNYEEEIIQEINQKIHSICTFLPCNALGVWLPFTPA